MTFEFVVAPAARIDIIDALTWSLEQFGPLVQDGYDALILATLDAIRLEPTRLGSHDRSDLGIGLRTLHLRACRDAVSPAVRRIASPRHFVLYRQDGNTIHVFRVLHDSMHIHIQEFPRG